MGGTLHYINDYDKLKFIFNQQLAGMIHEKRFPDSLIVVTQTGNFISIRDKPVRCIYGIIINRWTRIGKSVFQPFPL